jgi:hypothetical protein
MWKPSCFSASLSLPASGINFFTPEEFCTHATPVRLDLLLTVTTLQAACASKRRHLTEQCFPDPCGQLSSPLLSAGWRPGSRCVKLVNGHCHTYALCRCAAARAMVQPHPIAIGSSKELNFVKLADNSIMPMVGMQ